MPAPIPRRNREVYFVGAGLSCALGLPNTAGLLDGIFDLSAGKKHWGISKKLPLRLETAFRFFYPDAAHKGVRPDVVDFFSSLRTYIDIGSGFPGGFRAAADLYRSLKFAIAHLLIERTRAVEVDLGHGHEYLDALVRPGNIVITSNWGSRHRALRPPTGHPTSSQPQRIVGSPRGHGHQAPRLD